MTTTWMVKKYPHQTFQNAVVISGLPGVGNVGKIAVDFLIESLHANRIYRIASDLFPHCVFVSEKSTLDLPHVDIYYKKIGMNHFIFVTGDVQPIGEQACYTYCALLLDLLSHYTVKEIVTLGGVGLEDVPDNPHVYVAGTSLAMVKVYSLHGVKKHVPHHVGPIIGVTGVLLGIGKKRGISGAALLAETLAHPRYLGITGARELVSLINKKFLLKINMKALDKEVAAIEGELREKLEQIHTIIEDNVKKNVGEAMNYIG